MVTIVVLAMLGAPAGTSPESNSLEVNVSWAAPTECPNAAQFLAKVEQIGGRVLEFNPDATVGVEGLVLVEPEGSYRLDLVTHVDDQRETRTFEATTCDAVVDASALVTALALEPYARTEADAEAENPPLVPEPTSSPSEPLAPVAPAANSSARGPLPVATSPSTTSTSTRRRLTHALLVRAGGAMGLGLTTNVAAGIAGGLGWQRGRARVDLNARHWFRSTTTDNPGVGLTLSSGSVRGCFVIARGRVEIPLCGGVEAGRMQARGTGSSIVSLAQTISWVALLAGADVVFSATPWLGVVASVETAALPSRPVFHVGGAQTARTVYVAAPVNARFGLGLRARFSLEE